MILKILTKTIKDCHTYDYDVVKSPYLPLIIYDFRYEYTYCIMIVDLDAVDIQNNGRYILLHYLTINNSENLVTYIPPRPPKNSGIHRYVVSIFRQRYALNIESPEREDFKINLFIKNNDLCLLDNFIFMTSR